MSSRTITVWIIVSGLAVTSHLAATYARTFRSALGETVTSIQRNGWEPQSADRGISLAVLGGFRGLAADLTWVRAYVAWERHDAPLTASLVKLTTTLDARPLCFWLNGARMMAYDLPVWELEALSSEGKADEAARERLQKRAALDALAFLESGLRSHPQEPALRIEYANLQLNRLGDIAGAAESYRDAAALPGAPFYAARLHAELLRRIGLQSEALAYLVRLHPELPTEQESAGAAVVLSRIRTLELELGVDPSHIYRPSTAQEAADRTLTLNEVKR